MLDPGIGFGKTLEHDLEILRRLDEIVALGRPVVVGTSRKSFLGRITGREVGERLPGTIATNVLALERGASVFRVHEVAPVAMPWRWRLLRSGHGAGRPDEHDDEVDEIDDDEFDDEAAEGAETVVTIEIGGLSLYTHLGVSEEERKVGQRTVIDLRLDVGESDATLTDRVEDTVDYAEVCQTVALVAQQTFRTLERLCAAIATRCCPSSGGERLGQGGEAGAADPPPGRGGRGRGVARAVLI